MQILSRCPCTYIWQLQVLRDRPSFRRAFRDMLNDRLVACLFLTSLLSPRIDVAAFLWQKFKQGPSVVGIIKVRACVRA